MLLQATSAVLDASPLGHCLATLSVVRVLSLLCLIFATVKGVYAIVPPAQCHPVLCL